MGRVGPPGESGTIRLTSPSVTARVADGRGTESSPAIDGGRPRAARAESIRRSSGTRSVPDEPSLVREPSLERLTQRRVEADQAGVNSSRAAPASFR